MSKFEILHNQIYLSKCDINLPSVPDSLQTNTRKSWPTMIQFCWGILLILVILIYTIFNI